jgi:SAM-dependent methyltransferase
MSVTLRAVAPSPLVYRATRAWLTIARRFVKPGPDLWQTRNALIDRLAPGRSFLDLGGMFDIAGEVAFRAERAGATRVVLFDGMDPSPEFFEKHEAAGSAIKYVQGDLHDPADVERVGSFDVVWCAGVIYHSPNPYQCLYHLRRLADEYMLLGTHVIPELPGVEGACVFYPGRSKASEAAFDSAYGRASGTYPGMTEPLEETPNLGYANMWWGITPSALRGMLGYSGFEVEEWFQPYWFFVDALCTTKSPPDFIPPPGLSRARGEDRLNEWPGARPEWAL